jgi:hypothetical protein
VRRKGAIQTLSLKARSPGYLCDTSPGFCDPTQSNQQCFRLTRIFQCGFQVLDSEFWVIAQFTDYRFIVGNGGF